ncbi:hypothetical protein Tco_0959032, partial [Tanacetum coccineum]
TKVNAVRETTPERQPETEWVVPNPVSPGTVWRPWPSVPVPRPPTSPAQTLKWLVQEGTALGKDFLKSVDGCQLASPEQTATGKDVSNPLYGAVTVCQKLLGLEAATSFDSVVHRVHAVSFDAAVLDVAATVSAACIIATGYIVSAGICDAAGSFVLAVFIYSFLLEDLEAVPAGRLRSRSC